MSSELIHEVETFLIAAPLADFRSAPKSRRLAKVNAATIYLPATAMLADAADAGDTADVTITEAAVRKQFLITLGDLAALSASALKPFAQPVRSKQLLPAAWLADPA